MTVFNLQQRKLKDFYKHSYKVIFNTFLVVFILGGTLISLFVWDGVWKFDLSQKNVGAVIVGFFVCMIFVVGNLLYPQSNRWHPTFDIIHKADYNLYLRNPNIHAAVLAVWVTLCVLIFLVTSVLILRV